MFPKDACPSFSPMTSLRAGVPRGRLARPNTRAGTPSSTSIMSIRPTKALTSTFSSEAPAQLLKPTRIDGPVAAEREFARSARPDGTRSPPPISAVWLCHGRESVRGVCNMALDGVRALVFDTFGTVVDWYSGLAREAGPFLARHGKPDVDPGDFAYAWRKLEQPAMEEVRSGRRPFERLDVLHREILDAAVAEFGLDPARIPAAE